MKIDYYQGAIIRTEELAIYKLIYNATNKFCGTA